MRTSVGHVGSHYVRALELVALYTASNKFGQSATVTLARKRRSQIRQVAHQPNLHVQWTLAT